MKIIPYEKYHFKCSLTTEEAIAKLREYTEPNKLFRFGGGTKIFQGNIDDCNFNITRIISYRNSFLPQIKGNIIPEGNTIIIGIRMQLHPFVIAFMCIWFSGVILGCIAFASAFIGDIIHGRTIRPGFLIPFGLLFFGIGLCSLPFWTEVRKAKNELNKIFGLYME